VKLVGAGFGRTGTTSTKAALEVLGYGPVHHMSVVKSRRGAPGEWLSAARGRDRDWARLLAGYRSTLDWPTAAYWRELAEHYPEAKVLLTVRDPERWHDSIEQTLFHNAGKARGLRYRLLPWVTAVHNRDQAAFMRMTRRLIHEGVFSGDVTDRRRNIEVFERHIAQVKQTIAPERLLVFDITQGWQPLCDFLGVPVPDQPFPRLNDRDSYSRDGVKYGRPRPAR
jgi:hypothetical protein